MGRNIGNKIANSDGEGGVRIGLWRERQSLLTKPGNTTLFGVSRVCG